MDTKKTKVEFLKKLNNSKNGNPRWRISFDGLGTTDTPADVMWAYPITPQWEGKDVHVSFSKKKNGKTKLEYVGLVEGECHPPRSIINQGCLEILKELKKHSNWTLLDTGGGFNCFLWEGKNSHIMVTDELNECMAPTKWNSKWVVGHYTPSLNECFTQSKLIDRLFKTEGKNEFLKVVLPIIQKERGKKE